MPLFSMLIVAWFTTSHVSWIPSAGRTVGAGGREFTTTISVTNDSVAEAQVTLAFFPAAKPGAEPRTFQLSVPPHRVATHELGAPLTREGETTGALRITSTQDVTVEARVSSHDPALPESTVGATYAAVDASSAIGTAERTRFNGPSPGARYTLHAVETAGHSITMIATMFDANGRVLGSKRLYLGPNEQRSWNFADSFVQLELGGMSGSGKVVALATEILPGTQDIAAHAMTQPRTPRHRMPLRESVVYAIVALAIAAAVFVSRRKPIAS